jgi:hypothetical protein
MSTLKYFLKHPKIASKILARRIMWWVRLKISARHDAERWDKGEWQGPPPHVIKQRIITEYGRRYQCKVLVETGTYLGSMIAAQRNNFDSIISIELSPDLAEMARIRFANNPKVSIVQGDSAQRLPGVVASLQGPTVFWLDGHYSSGVTARADADCPVVDELKAIFANCRHKHVILIDDAVLFDGTNSYPSFNAVTEQVHKYDPSYTVTSEADIIRCVPLL